MKTSELTGALLDCWVAKALDPAEKVYLYNDGYGIRWHRKPNAYSTDWELGGPIIERERLHITWDGFICGAMKDHSEPSQMLATAHEGRTPLIAAMRAFVASKFGDTVEPDEMKP